ncbi:unnamed protein product [Aphanomyces euteiches]|nr:hypothetical protein AeMF1_001519 [Aphanomyces euteiches]KAH9144051.1 hypothetical protein AeRB84_011989 [Aphanomyces euteiches]KAH9183839.1 hypothetical protein AeNC1_014185 [Aphanomyces euteiches]
MHVFKVAPVLIFQLTSRSMQYFVKVVTAAALLVAVLAAADFIVDEFGLGCNYGEAYPYQTHAGCYGPAYDRIIDNGGSGPFISLRFLDFRLPSTDYIVLRSLSTNASVKLYGKDYSGAFDAPAIPGEKLHFKLFTHQRRNKSFACVGFRVSGYTSMLETLPSNESICGGVDRSLDAACYSYNQVMTTRARAVARLVINKGGVLSACTGFLLGSGGHFLTNNACLSSSDHAINTRFEFMAQAPGCPTRAGDIVCTRQLACPGDVWRGNARFITTNIQLDYTLLLLDKSLAAKFSFLKLRDDGPIANEPIYIVQHPLAWGKRIADKTTEGKAAVEFLTAKDAAYRLDTQPMSSGSPVLSTKDHAVVAMHHGGAAACPNFGVRSNLIVADMKRQGVLPPDSVA